MKFDWQTLQNWKRSLCFIKKNRLCLSSCRLKSIGTLWSVYKWQVLQGATKCNETLKALSWLEYVQLLNTGCRSSESCVARLSMEVSEWNDRLLFMLRFWWHLKKLEQKIVQVHVQRGDINKCSNQNLLYSFTNMAMRICCDNLWKHIWNRFVSITYQLNF